MGKIGVVIVAGEVTTSARIDAEVLSLKGCAEQIDAGVTVLSARRSRRVG